MIKYLLSKLQCLSLRNLFLLLVALVGLPAVLLLIFSGVNRYRHDVEQAYADAQDLANGVASALQLQVSSAQQLMEALSLLPSVREHNAEATHLILCEFVANHPIYGNILIADRQGRVWTAAADVYKKAPSMADRRAFKDALRTGRFSAGEYVIGKLTQKPIINFAYPITEPDGTVTDVVMFGISLEQTSDLLKQQDLPAQTNFVILDHAGTFLYRGIGFESYLGRKDRSDLFARTVSARTDTGIFDAQTNDGTRRLVAFRKLRLRNGEEPYVYVRAGIPYDAIVTPALTSLVYSLTLLGSFIGGTLVFAWLLGQHLVVKRVAILQRAARQMADGDLQSRIGREVLCGDFGELASSLDQMAEALERDRIARNASEEALRASEARFRDIVMSSGDWVWEVDEAGRYTFVSGRIEALLGYRPEELLGKTPFELMPPEEAERVLALYRQLRTQCAPIQDLENFNLTKDGRLVCLQTCGVPILDAQGKVCGYRGIDKDISDRKEAERRLRQALYDAEAANRAKNEFLANMSHELRTPLNGALGMLQLLQGSSLDEEQLSLVETASSCGWSLLLLLNDLLDLARIEAGNLCLHETETDLSALVQDVISVFRLEIATKQLKISSRVTPAPQNLLVDPLRVRQMLLNLFGNAVKFTPQGEIRVEITLLEVMPSQRARIEIVVSDNGIGIDAEKLPLLGHPFFQGESGHTRKFQGAGLGLSIVKRLVELMHGTMDIASRKGEGTTVTLRFEAGVRSLPERWGESQGAAGPEPLPPLRILVAEDNPVNLKALQGMLSKDGHRVVTAVDGVEALEKFRTEGFDLLLIDIQMPGMDGIETCRRIRSLPGGETVPIVAVTAHAMPGDSEHFLGQGLTDYLAKPFSKAELVKLLRKHAPPGGGRAERRAGPVKII